MAEERIMARMAELFYVYDMSQYKLAEKFGYSKSKVCRILKDAKRRGIIKFRIDDYNERVIELERNIEEKFGLREAIIYHNSDIHSYNEEMNFREVGKLAAEYIERVLKDKINMAITWGKTLYNFVKEINPAKKYKINTFSTLGGINLSKSEYQNNNLVKLFSEKVGGDYYHIYLPLIIPEAGQRNSLLKETGINKILGDTSKIDYFITSLGTISNKSRMFELKAFDIDFLKTLKEKKVVGEMGLNFFDENGNFIDPGINDRTINLSIEEIKKIKNKIVIVHEKEKVKSLSSFLKTGITDVLITDSLSAEKILK